MAREETLDQLANRIAARIADRPLRVAIDGVDASSKTTLANELAPLLIAWGHPVIHASVDGFHRPRAERYRRGPDSPEGYYHDSFDYAALRDYLLLPLGPGGSRRIRRAVFDLAADRPLAADEEVILISSWPLSFLDALRPPVELRRGAHEVRTLLERDTAGGLDVFELVDCGEMAVDETGVGQGPEVLSRL